MTGVGIPIEQSPAQPSMAYREQAAAIRVCRDVMAGTEHMRSRKTEYLPKSTAESPRSYAARLSRALLFNALKRTVNGLVGMIFRRDPQLKDADAEMEEHWKDIDNAGTHGAVFCKEFVKDAMSAGHAGILVDYPKVESGLTIEQKATRKIRPFWVRYAAEDIMSCRVSVEDGRMVLTQVVLRENIEKPVNEYVTERVVQYRVLKRGAGAEGGDRVTLFEVWQPTAKGDGYVRTDDGMMDVPEIPFTALVAEASPCGGYMRSVPPLLDLADVNIAHYQVYADHRHALHVASVPILVFVGRDTSNPAVKIAPNVGIDMPVGGSCAYTETKGAALSASRTELQDLEQRAAALGLAMLQRQSRAAETEAAKAIDKSESDSALATIARQAQEAINQASKFHAMWRNKAKPATFDISRDFESLTLTAQEVDSFNKLHTDGKISLDTLWDMLERGEILPPGFDREKEKAAIEEESVGKLPTFPAPPAVVPVPGQPDPAKPAPVQSPAPAAVPAPAV